MTKIKAIGIGRVTAFNGRRKVGIDTNVFIKLYQQPYLFDYEQARIFNYSDLIFTHSICRFELIKYLMKEGKSLEEAKAEANSFIRGKRVNIIFSSDCYITEEDADSFEKYANEEFKKNKQKVLTCHKPDSIILLAFKKCNINKVLSTDESIKEGAKLLGMDGAGLPSLDYIISKKLKGMFDYNYKKEFKGRHRKR